MEYRFPGKVLLALITILPLCACAPSAREPRTFYLDGDALVKTRRQIVDREPAFQPAMNLLLADAKVALDSKPTSVLDKQTVGPSGNKHDYVSFAPYFWPNPDTKDGLPYVRHDGHHNEELVKQGDAVRLKQMIVDVDTLSLAYWFTHDAAYSRHAALLLRTWFLDPATRMNPNFQYAQAIRGVTEGRGIGLIEFRGMYLLVDDLGLLDDAPGWSAADAAGMHAWLEQYYQWIKTSQNAHDEEAAKNNHGSWIDAQECALTLYLGHNDDARAICERARSRIAVQINLDGQEPLETVREDALGYSLGNIRGLATTAVLARHVGIDLWRYKTNDDRNIRLALDFILPVFTNDKPWPWHQLRKLDADEPLPIVLEAVEVFGDAGFDSYIQKLPADKFASNRSQLLFANFPLYKPADPNNSK